MASAGGDYDKNREDIGKNDAFPQSSEVERSEFDLFFQVFSLYFAH
jgi:hypothetical protein